MTTPYKYNEEEVKSQEGNCGCCGEPVENLYENPWSSPMNSYGMSYDCIMEAVEMSYDENYEGGWDLTTDSEYWKAEYKKTIEEKIVVRKGVNKEGEDWFVDLK
tara:strand:- start:584 stop:895 length:312 start_codon:yes stop_codon:yes gene_type:complete